MMTCFAAFSLAYNCKTSNDIITGVPHAIWQSGQQQNVILSLFSLQIESDNLLNMYSLDRYYPVFVPEAGVVFI